MGVNLHEKAGALLQGLSYVNVGWRLEALMEEVRAELAVWLSAEEEDALGDRHDFYYGSSSDLRSTHVRRAAIELIAILRAGYVDCSPRRKLIEQLEKFIARVDKLPKKEVVRKGGVRTPAV